MEQLRACAELPFIKEVENSECIECVNEKVDTALWVCMTAVETQCRR